jgi:prephenate dehydrogenase
MQTFSAVAIVGVGLIGGSIGLALRQRGLCQRVVGIGRRIPSLEAALAHGCVTEVTTSIAEGVRETGLVVVCTPVETIAQHIAEAARHCPEGCVLTDAGSTKAAVVKEVEAALAGRFPSKLPFVGSHPIAGSERSGPAAAQADLFAGRVVVVTATDRSDQRAITAIESFWQSLGASIVRKEPEEHDALLACTSHLPHLVAAALAATTPADGEALLLTGSGWADTTRIAAGDPELWRQIFLANRGATLKALTDFETVLKTWRDALQNGDGSLLIELLKEGKRRRDAVGS